MQESQSQKTWWAPVWNGLVMDQEARHCRRMKNALWLYLYLLVNANRVTGMLMRKTGTISRDMGIPRDMALRWLNVLRKEGYIATSSNGRSLTIQISNFRSLAKHGKTRPQMSEKSDSSRGKYPLVPIADKPPLPLYFAANSGPPAKPKETEINKLFTNETPFMQSHAIARTPEDRAFKRIGLVARQELLAWELANAFDDPAGIDIYRSYCRRFTEEQIRTALREARQSSAVRHTQGRSELFMRYLL